jgi:AcrR family transcriptional regulator
MGYNVTEKRKRKKSDIRALALQLILEAGLEGLTMHLLAKRQGVTVGALYRYFESKQVLLAELELQCLEAICTTLKEAYVAQQSLEFSAHWGLLRLWGIVAAYRKHLVLEPAHARLISGILASPNAVVSESFRVQAVSQMFDVLDVPAQLIGHLQIGGDLTSGDPQQRALTLWLTIHGVLQLEKMEAISGGLINVNELLRQSLCDLYQGWSVRNSIDLKLLLEVI